MAFSPRAASIVALLAWMGSIGCARRVEPHAHAAAPETATLASASATPSAVVAARPTRSSRVLLGGDFHAHVAPADEAWDVTRDPHETVELAARAGLDFVVLTPHVPARFFLDDVALARVRTRLSAMHDALAREPAHRTLFVEGFEYTDHAFGHVGAAFADLDRVLADLADLDRATLRARPSAFFEAWVREGGTLVVNHPFVTPLDSIFGVARMDMSWRPWTTPGRRIPDEIRAVDALAQGVEAYNVEVTELRDRFLVGDATHGLERALATAEATSAKTGRPIAAVGGSDSHGHWLRATTWVLAGERSVAAIREAFVEGRTCVRAKEACSFTLRAPGGAWASIGDAIATGAPNIEARADGDATFYVDGHAVATAHAGETAAVPVPAGRCVLVHARVEDGWSSPIRVGCAPLAPSNALAPLGGRDTHAAR